MLFYRLKDPDPVFRYDDLLAVFIFVGIFKFWGLWLDCKTMVALYLTILVKQGRLQLCTQ